MKKTDAVITWNDAKDGKQKALAFSQLYSALQNYQVPVRHTANASNTYKDVYQQGISIRDEYGRSDYDQYRPSDRLPRSPKAIKIACMEEYDTNGIIHNIIDLMGDFASQGIELNHPVKAIENFHREWFKKVNGYIVTERIANYLCRMADVICTRESVKVPLGITREMYTEGSNKPPEPEKRTIPWGYTFLNPVTLDVVGEELMGLTNLKSPIFAVNITRTVAALISNPTAVSYINDVLQYIPDDIKSQIKKGNRKVALDPTKTRHLGYKKDDWKVWSNPMIYSILEDLQILRKMKQADVAALDGAISQIRIWKVGSLEHKIVPSEAVINRLAEILMNNMGGGIMDLIWGPDLEYQETQTSLHNFLGETKYVPTLNRIFAGLGIPPLFSGSSTQGGFTNNFIAIKTLIERLNYVRILIRQFWDFELKIVQKAMGFRKPATLSFDRMTLNDESSVLTLMKDLADRNYLSVETLQEMVGTNPEIESVRLNREEKLRKKKKLPPKLGPYVSTEDVMKKSLAALGIYTADELGVELEGGGAKVPEQVKQKFAPKPTVPSGNKKGVAGQGRPKASNDKIKRKQKVVKPRQSVKGTFLHSFVVAEDLQKSITETLTPLYLTSKNKKNLRQLTAKEFEELENRKFAVLCNITPDNFPSTSSIESLFATAETPEIYSRILEKYLHKYSKDTGNEITIERRRTAQSGVYAMLNSEKVGNETDNPNYDLPTLPGATEVA